MPADTMPACNECFHQSFRKTNDAKVKSGFLVLLTANSTRQHVRVVVYRTSIEHFAVLYPRKRISMPLGVINLRNTYVHVESCGFVVRQKGLDDTISAKFVCSEREVASWMTAFDSRMGQGPLTSLPVLIETEELNL